MRCYRTILVLYIPPVKKVQHTLHALFLERPSFLNAAQEG